MTRSRYSGGCDQIQGNTLIVNPGDDLQVAYDALVADTSMGTLSESNRRYMWLTPGTYTGDLDVDTRYVHLRVMEGVVLSGAVTHSNWYGTAFGTGAGDSYTNAKNIDLPEAFLEYCDTADDHDLYIKQTANIDFTDMIQCAGQIANDSTSGYDGQGFRTENIVLADNPGPTSGNALYRYNNAEIKNMVFISPTLLSSSPTEGAEGKSYAGIIVSQNLYGGVVRNCHVVDGAINHKHTLTGNALIGMAVGSNHGSIFECTSSGVLAFSASSGDKVFVGGICGYQTGGASGGQVGMTVNCNSSATITTPEYTCDVNDQFIGGICGECVPTAEENVITNCHFDGSIIVKNTTSQDGAEYFIGGILGRNSSGPITRSSAKGLIECDVVFTGAGTQRIQAGGGIGFVSSGDQIQKCFADVEMRIGYSGGSVEDIGGFVGRSDGDIDDCYAKGSIYDLTASSTALEFSGYGGFAGRSIGGAIDDCWCAIDTYTDTGSGIAEGFVASNTGTITTCYWDSDTCGIATGASAGAYDDKTTAEMVANATFAAWSLNTSGTWKQADLVDYPKLFWE